MPKYMIQASYTAEGVRGLMKDGGSKRRAAAESAVKGVGGKLDAFYFAFGDTDVYAIAELPDNASAAAVALVVTGSGAVNARTIVLMTPEEIDQATKKTPNYRPPGH
ncbi:MAG TPA: GYD domain-containing protein [Methylomirabilota bacterium]|nr:GYD domain-containing protein [Methylomirabilota bacterium]